MKMKFILLMASLALLVYASPPTDPNDMGDPIDSILNGTSGSDGQGINFKEESENGNGAIQEFWAKRGNEFLAMLLGMSLTCFILFLILILHPGLRSFQVHLLQSLAREAVLQQEIAGYQNRETRMREIVRERGKKYQKKVKAIDAILEEAIPRTMESSFEVNAFRFILAFIATALMAIITFDVEKLSPNFFHNLAFGGVSIGACSVSAAFLEFFRWKLAKNWTSNVILSSALAVSMFVLMEFTFFVWKRKDTFVEWNPYSENPYSKMRIIIPTVVEAVYIAQQLKAIIMGMFVCNMLAKCAANYVQALLNYLLLLVAIVIIFAVIVTLTGPLPLSVYAEIAFLLVALLGCWYPVD